MTFTIFDLIMRAALLGLLVAPLALFAPGNEAKAFPLYGASESVTCAAVGDDRITRAVLGCPTMAWVTYGGPMPVSPFTPSNQPLVRISAPSESVMCAAAGNDRMLRAVLGC